jgi:hypothetical protein
MSTATATPMSEKVHFDSNQTQTITLGAPDGRMVEGRFGDQYFYKLADGRSMYLDPGVHAALQKHRPQRGDSFEITKRSTGTGSRRKVEWEVIQVADIMEPEEYNYTPAPTDPPPPVTRHAEPATMAQASRDGQPAPKPVRSAEMSEALHQARSAAAQGLAQDKRAALSLTLSLLAAIDAVNEAEKYAGSHGLRLQFGAEDVRCLALSLYISAERAGGAR